MGQLSNGMSDVALLTFQEIMWTNRRRGKRFFFTTCLPEYLPANTSTENELLPTL